MTERTLIVGGGIGGLATAVGLARAGVPCEVVERTEAWAPIGAGIVLGVNAMRVMRELGLADRIVEVGTALGRGAITDHLDRPIGSTDFALLEPEFGPTIALHRAELHDVLLEAAKGVPISLGTSVDEIEQRGDAVDVRLTDGREERFGLVIGADGVRSRVRELLFGPEALSYSGYTCWRCVVDLESDEVALREMWGRGKRFGVVPISGGRSYCFATANAPRGRPDPPEGRIERFRATFAEFGGQIPAVLDALRKPEELIHNDLEERVDGPWFAGRVLLLGDAAHAMTPNIGQGAAMALEDAWVLADLLQERLSVDALLPRLYDRRISRVRWVQNQSRRLGQVGQLEGRWTCRARDAVLRLVPDSAKLGALRKMARQPI